MLGLLPLEADLPSIALEDGADEILGRGADSSIRIADPRLGRRHARIRCEKGQITVEDLESPSGLFVNGLRAIGATRVQRGDEVRFGGLRFRVDELSAATVDSPNEPRAAFERIGYQLGDLLGGGLFSRTVRARHADREVVLKIARYDGDEALAPGPHAKRAGYLHTGSYGPSDIHPNRVVEAEADVLEKIHDPAFPRLLDRGALLVRDQPVAWFAEELRVGQSWTVLLADRAARPTLLRVRHVSDVANVLARLAASGVLPFHGDIKPENLLLHAEAISILDPSSGAWELDAHGNTLHALGTRAFNESLLPSDVPAIGHLLHLVLGGAKGAPGELVELASSCVSRFPPPSIHEVAERLLPFATWIGAERGFVRTWDVDESRLARLGLLHLVDRPEALFLALDEVSKRGQERLDAWNDEASRRTAAKLLRLFFQTKTDHGCPLSLPAGLATVRPGVRATPGILERWPDGLPGESAFGPRELLALGAPDLPDYVVTGEWGYGVGSFAFWWIEKQGEHFLLCRWPREEEPFGAVEFLRGCAAFRSAHGHRLRGSNIICNMGFASAVVTLASGREISIDGTWESAELFARLGALVDQVPAGTDDR